MGAGTVCPLIKLILVNAIYFKAKWNEQFDRKHTRGMPFKTNQVGKHFADILLLSKVILWERHWERLWRNGKNNLFHTVLILNLFLNEFHVPCISRIGMIKRNTKIIVILIFLSLVKSIFCLQSCYLDWKKISSKPWSCVCIVLSLTIFRLFLAIVSDNYDCLLP